MNASNSSPQRATLRTVARATVRAVSGLGLALALLAAVPSARAQSDDFNSGNDSAWTKFNLADFVPPDFAPLVNSTFAFVDDGLGGLAYKITSPPSSLLLGTIGPSRAAAYRTQVTYAGIFSVSADLLDWPIAGDSAVGVLAYFADIAPGTSSGYLLNLNATDGNLELNQIGDPLDPGQGEQPNGLGDVPVWCSPTLGPYHLEFSGHNGLLLGRMFRHTDHDTPIASMFANNTSWSDGLSGFLVYDDSGADQGVFGTYDNYLATTPDILRATLVQALPLPDTSVNSPPGTTTFAMGTGILSRDTTIDPANVRFFMDGTEIPRANLVFSAEVKPVGRTTVFPGVTVSYSYQPANLFADIAGTHKNKVIWVDSASFAQTNEWSYTFAYLKTANARPAGSGKTPGFKVRLVQTTGATYVADSLARAQGQLATPPTVPINLETNATASVINYTKNGLPSNDGYFPDAATFPGIPAGGNAENMAMEISGYLEVPAGTHTFGVRSDDGFQFRSGATVSDPIADVFAQKVEGTYDGTFTVLAEKAGVYPFQMTYFNSGGPGNVELFFVTPGSGTKVLINDATCPVKAYQDLNLQPVTLFQCDTVNGTYVVDTQAIYSQDATSNLITVPLRNQAQFFRFQLNIPPANFNLMGVEIQGSNFVIRYKITGG